MSLDQYTCEQEEQKRRDEALARLLQQAENQEIQKKTTQEESDSQLALKLLLEEKLQIEKEAELQKVSEQVAKQMQFDEALAEKLAAEVRSGLNLSLIMAGRKKSKICCGFGSCQKAR
jgi:hypothetical protein